MFGACSSVLSRLTIISLARRELIALLHMLLFFFSFHVVVRVLCLFLQCVLVVNPGHIHLLSVWRIQFYPLAVSGFI